MTEVGKIEFAPDYKSEKIYTPWGDQPIPPCSGHAFQHPEEDTFMVSATTNPGLQGYAGKLPPTIAAVPDSFCDRILGAPRKNDYADLRAVLDEAYNHAARGKGKERHANGRPFADQPMMTITRDVGLGFPLGQAMKKAQEAGGMADRGEYEAAVKECLGAINYLAGAVMRARELEADYISGERAA